MNGLLLNEWAVSHSGPQDTVCMRPGKGPTPGPTPNLGRFNQSIIQSSKKGMEKLNVKSQEVEKSGCLGVSSHLISLAVMLGISC